MIERLFRRKKKSEQPFFYEKPGKFYVILIDDKSYKTSEIWINVDRIFKRLPKKGDCFRYDVNGDRKPAHCTVIAICDTEKEAREIAKNTYI